MATASYLIKFGADSSSVSKAITSVNSDIRSLNSQARSLDTAFKLTGDTSVLSQKLGVLKNLIGATEAKSQGLKTQLANLRGSAGFDENSAKAVNLRNQIAQTDAQTTKLKAQLATANSRGLESATQASGGLNKSIGAGTIAMGSFIGSLASKAVSAGIGLITSNMDGAIKRIDTLNNSARNFANMGVDAQTISKEMKNLQGAIQGLPTPLDSAVSGVQLLTSSMNGDMPQSVKVFKALNDGILGFGGNTEMVNNAMIQLSQSFSNGKVDGETWNSMINSGMGPALNALAKTMGKTTGQLKEGLSSGKISVKDFQDRLIELDTKGGGGLASLGQIAQDGTKGISTSMANAKTAVTRGVADLVTAVDSGIGSLNIETPLGKITGIGSIFTQLGTVAENVFKGMAQSIPSAIETINGSISTIKGVADGVKPALDNLFNDITVPQFDFEPVISGVTNFIAFVGGLFSRLDFSGFVSAWDMVTQGIMAGVTMIGNFVMPAIQPLMDAFNGLVESSQPLLGAFSELWSSLQPLVSLLGGVLMTALAGIGAIIGGVLYGAVMLLTAGINVLSTVFQFLAPVISAISAVIQNVVPMFQDLWTMGVNVATAVGQAFVGLNSTMEGWRSALAGVFSAVGSAFSAFGSAFMSIVDGIVGAFQGAVQFIASGGTAMGTTAGNIVGFFNGIGGRIASGFNGVIGMITSNFNGVMERIASFFTGAGDIGRNIVEGIKGGITGAIRGLVNTAADMAKSALDGAKRALGIHSPSRVFRDMVGAFIPAGVAVGIESNLGVLDGANDSMRDRLLGGFQSFDMGNVSGNLGNMVSESGTAVDNSTIVNINVSADSTSNARSIANEVKLVLRQQGINAR